MNKTFMAEDFLLQGNTANTLYHDVAKKLPIIDYHCHIDPNDIAENKEYANITELWLGADHYKWRAMRSCGVEERLITGDAAPEEKFMAWATTLPNLIGNPLYHWTHLELARYFGVNEPLSSRNANEIYLKCNAKLKNEGLSAKKIMQQSNVETICTTDDPADLLQAHLKIKNDTTFDISVLPTFRPDKAIAINKPGYAAYIEKLSGVVDRKITSYSELKNALVERLEFFYAMGCRISDHGLDQMVYAKASDDELNAAFLKALSGERVSEHEANAFITAMLVFCANQYNRLGITMQLHFGCLRNPSEKMFKKLGADTGYDSMGDSGSAANLAKLLSEIEASDALPKTILYPLNPFDSPAVMSVMGAFQTDGGRLCHGSAWWFNDHKPGMEMQLTQLASLGALGKFVGMLTDSRSFLSYTRHEYFRRILCNLIGAWVDNGEYPNDFEQLSELVTAISYSNAKTFIGL